MSYFDDLHTKRIARLAEDRATVALARTTEATLKQQLAVAQAKFEREYAGLIAEISEATTTRQFAETRLRVMAVEHYRVTDDKKPIEGVSIRINSTVVYDDGVVVAWLAERGLTEYLKLDKRPFDSWARQGKVEVATVRSEPVATIARELPDPAGGEA